MFIFNYNIPVNDCRNYLLPFMCFNSLQSLRRRPPDSLSLSVCFPLPSPSSIYFDCANLA